MRKILVYLLILLSVSIVSAAEEQDQYRITFYAPDQTGVVTEGIYVYGHSIKLEKANEQEATFRINNEEVSLAPNERKEIEGVEYAVLTITPIRSAEIGDKFYAAKEVRTSITQEDPQELSQGEYIVLKDQSVTLTGGDFVLDEISIDQATQETFARIQFGGGLGYVHKGDKIIFYGLPLEVKYITASRGAQADLETRSIYIRSDITAVDLSYFPSMFRDTKIPVKVVTPNHATDAQIALADALVTYLADQNSMLNIVKTTDNFLTSHTNVQLLLIGDACQNEITAYYDPQKECNLPARARLLKKENKYVISLEAANDEEYRFIQENIWNTKMQGQTYSFSNVPLVAVEEAPSTFEMESIITPEPQEQQEEKEQEIKGEIPKVQEKAPQEPKKPKGESRFIASWKKVWQTILFFMR